MTWLYGIDVGIEVCTLAVPPFTLVDMTGTCVIGELVVEVGGGGDDWVISYPGSLGVLFLGGRNTVVLLLLTL